MSKISYVNLHSHSHWSILDATCNYSDYCDVIDETPGQVKSFAMTEHGNLIGTIDYLNTCYDRGYKPLVGMEAYMCTEQQWQDYQEDSKKAPKRYHLVILAKNKQGYKDLVAMNNYCVKEHRVFVSRIGRWYVLQTPEILRKFNKGNWFVAAACVGSYVFQPYNFEEDMKTSVERFKEMRDIFGEDFYFEFQFLNIPSQRRMNELQVKLMAKFPDQKAIVTCDSHYHRPGLGELRDIVMSMNWKTTLKQFKIITSKNKDGDTEEQVNIHFRTNDELYDEWKEFHSDIVPEDIFQKACQTTLDIYEEIKPFKLDKSQNLDTLRQYFDEDADAIVKKKCVEGFKKKVAGKENAKQYLEQLKHELSIVEEKKIAPYFLALLTVLDNLKAKDQYIGIGRGSAGSFLINYLLGLTNLDPVEHGLMSERFLDSARKDYPDIDTDVEDRDTMYRIFKETFSNHDVVLLSNRNTLSVKALMKAVWKTLDIDIPIKADALDSADKISKYLDDNYNIITFTLDQFLNDKVIRGYLEEYADRNTGIDLEKVLKELYQNLSAISVHAGGIVVIDPKENIVPYVPLLGNTMCHYATAFCESASYKELEQIGHIKFDMLGLGNLRCLHKTVDMVSKDFGISKEVILNKIDPMEMDLKIPKVFAGFQKGFTEGIFQFASDGMTSILQGMRAESIEELTMANALYRPGPLGSKIHELVIKNKFADEEEKMFSDELWSKIGYILDSTYGTFVYEEQIMKIGREIGKFDPSQLNRFRKFLKEGQKIVVDNKRLYNKLRKEFYDQFMKEGIAQDLDSMELEKLWQMMVKFSSYSFNKSHALAYSLLAYQTMYMSVTFPGHWYAEVLNESPGKLNSVIEEVKVRMKEDLINLRFRPPQLGNFHTRYTFVPDEKNNPYDGTIYIGLRHIKGFGAKAMPQMETLIGQSFESVEDVLKFIKDNKLNAINKTALLAMADIGMFQELCPNRAKARAIILLEKDNSYKVEVESEGKRKKWRKMTISEAIAKDKADNNIGNKFFFIKEKEAIGVPFVDNPANFLKKHIRKYEADAGNQYIDGGLISGFKKKKTKTGKPYYLIYIDSVKKRCPIMFFVWEKTINKLGEKTFEFSPYDTVVVVSHENDWKPNTFNLDNILVINEEEEDNEV